MNRKNDNGFGDGIYPRKAPDILQEAAKDIEQRAKERDLPCERSMERTVEAFNALTGHDLTETEGWLFMALLKIARATAGSFQQDDLKDCAAYAALALESAIAEQRIAEIVAGMRL